MNEGIAEPGAKAIISEDLNIMSSSINRDGNKLQEMTGESPGARGDGLGLWAKA